jgi:hypothetical protein
MSSRRSATLEPPLLGVQEPQIVHLPPDVHSLDAATEAIELAEAVGMDPDESQRFTLRTALGERKDGSWAAFEVADVEPRQNGKGDTEQIRELAGLFLLGERLLIHTAHEFATANEAFLRMAAIVDGCPDLSKQVARIRYANGEQGIELMSGARLKYRARTGGAGRGFAGADLVVYDEAYALMAEHVAASLPTLSTSPNPQVWFGSSSGLAMSTQLWALRKRALAGNAGRLAYCEHTAEDVWFDEQSGKVMSRPIDISDRRLWAMANPAFGYRIAEEYVEAEFAAMPAEQFARERLGVFDPLPDEHGDPKLPVEAWRDTARVTESPDSPVATLTYDVDIDGKTSSIAVGLGTISSPYVEVIEHRPGVAWLPERLVELIAEWKPTKVACNGAGPAGAQVGPVMVALRDAGIDSDVFVQLGSREYQQACGGFYTDVVEGRLRRPKNQQPLDLAGEDAGERPLAEAWVWDRRQATVPISPLVAVTIARALLPVEVEAEQSFFAY